MEHAPVAVCTVERNESLACDDANKWSLFEMDDKSEPLVGSSGEYLLATSHEILDQVMETRKDVTVDRLELNGDFHSAKFHYDASTHRVVVYVVEIPVAALDSTTHVRFLSNMSHELRTPIGVMSNSLMVMRQINRQRALKKHIDMCVVAQKQMRDLVSDLLDAAVLEEGQFKIRPSLCNLVVVTSQCLADVRTLSHKHNKILFKMEVLTSELKDFYCSIDRLRYRQVLTNLLSNAEKFTDSGYVKLTLGLSETDASTFVVKVIDTGCGIKPGSKVYRRFRTETGTDRTGNYGRGLGLWITKQIVDRMGGSIEFSRRDGPGTVFTVELPYTRRGPIHAATVEEDTDQTTLRQYLNESPESARRKDERPLHVLVAEDRRENRITLEALFEIFHIESSYAMDGKQCLDMWISDVESESPKYDCIFMDCHMPVMDGYQSTRAIRAYEKEHPDRRRAYIVAATASVINGDEKRKKCGMDEFIGKPFQLDRLVEIFNHVKTLRTYSESSSK